MSKLAICHLYTSFTNSPVTVIGKKHPFLKKINTSHLHSLIINPKEKVKKTKSVKKDQSSN